MLISIITINFNNQEGLQKTIDSVLKQTKFDKIEYIVIDGGSTDGSYGILKSLPKNIKWISEKDNGISDAFNKGLKFATGNFILFLNSGDYFINNCIIERILPILENSPVDMVSFKVQVSKDIYIPSSDNKNVIYKTCTEPHQGTFVSRELYKKIGFYSEEYKIRMDYQFFARCRNYGATFKYVDKVIVKYEEGGVSMKKENRIRFWKEGMSVKFHYNLPVELKDYAKLLIYRKNCL